MTCDFPFCLFVYVLIIFIYVIYFKPKSKHQSNKVYSCINPRLFLQLCSSSVVAEHLNGSFNLIIFKLIWRVQNITVKVKIILKFSDKLHRLKRVLWVFNLSTIIIDNGSERFMEHFKSFLWEEISMGTGRTDHCYRFEFMDCGQPKRRR